MATVAILIAACGGNSADSTATETELRTVTVSELKEITDQDSTAWILDVRRPDEYRQVHIPAVKQLIVHTEIEESQSLLPADKEEPIYVVCRTGRRSGIAGKELIRLGYKNVFNVTGGTTEWVKEGFETDSGDGVLGPADQP